MTIERRVNRETIVNTHLLRRPLALAIVMLLGAGSAQAVKFGDFEINGFAKDEFSMCDNCSLGLSNPSSYDPRGVLTPPTPMLNQPGPSGQTTANLGLAMLTIGANLERKVGPMEAISMRFAADLLLADLGGTALTWGGTTADAATLRAEYINALHLADRGELDALIEFATRA